MTRKNQKANVRVLECIGGTGNGKTEFATIPAAPEARKILLRGVGYTNSTLTDRLTVYTTEYVDKIVVSVKYNTTSFSRNDFTEIVSKAITSVTRETGKALEGSETADREVLLGAFREELTQKNNIKAVLSLLKSEQLDAFINAFLSLYSDYVAHADLFTIYNTAKNKIDASEAKKNSRKFFSAIQSEAEKMLDNQPDEFKSKFWQIWAALNEDLAAVFFSYFDMNDISPDGYYCKDLYLSNPDMNFIEAMFTKNELRDGGKLSLEVLCDEIILYVPMNRIFADMISKNPLTSAFFRDSSSHIVFANLDTRGLYHSDSTDGENVDYCSELLYKGNIDGIAVIVPLVGDTNEKKTGMAYRGALKNYTRETPIFAVHNKVDMFVDSIMKDSSADPLSLEPLESAPLNNDDIKAQIQRRADSLDEDFKVEQTKANKRSVTVISLPCYLKRDGRFPQALALEYSPLRVYEIILTSIATTFQKNALKVRFQISQGQIPTPTIDRTELLRLVRNHILDPNTHKQVFTPGSEDLAHNMGKVPHGNAYYALRRRVRNGDGYTSNIDASYYYNCQSFSVNFTANVRNFASPVFLQTAVLKTLSVNDARFTQQDFATYLKLVVGYIDSKKLVSILLFDRAMQKAETEFSFGRKFQSFLTNSTAYLVASSIDAVSYTDAVASIILDAANKALAQNVIFC